MAQDAKEEEQAYQVVVITGGTRGIGLAAALAAASYKENGKNVFKVYATGRKIDANAVKIPSDLQNDQATKDTVKLITFLPLDVTVDESVAAFVKAVTDKEKRIDFVVNNAGIGVPANAVETIPLADIRKVYEVNVFGTVRIMQAFIPIMRKQATKQNDGTLVNGGTIINMSSCISNGAFPFIASYCSTKAAVDRLTEAAALELQGSGVTLRIISPGAVATEFAVDAFDKEADFANLYPNYKNFKINFSGMFASADKAPVVGVAILEMMNGKRKEYRSYPTNANQQFHETFLKDSQYGGIFAVAKGILSPPAQAQADGGNK